MAKNKYRFLEVADAVAGKLLLLPSHTPVPSLNELIENYAISQSTAKRTMLELQQRGIIYSKVGSGSFVAPLARRNTILIAFDLEKSLKCRDMFNQEFLVAALIHCNRQYPGYTVMAVDFAELQHNTASLDVCYPNLKGVVFLRYISEYREQVQALEKLGVPSCFYGSSAYLNDLHKLDYLVYNEASIMKASLDAIIARGCVRVGVANAPDFKVYFERQKQLERILKLQHIKYAFLNYQAIIFNKNSIKCIPADRKTRDILRSFFTEIDGLICMSDHEAITLARAAMELGFSVPDEIVVVGVNDFPWDKPCTEISSVGINTVADAKRCVDLLMKRVITGQRFQEEAEITLIERVN